VLIPSASFRENLGDIHRAAAVLLEDALVVPIGVFRELSADIVAPDLFPEAPSDALVRIEGAKATLLWCNGFGGGWRFTPNLEPHGTDAACREKDDA
jgi:hypothetical protein